MELQNALQELTALAEHQRLAIGDFAHLRSEELLALGKSGAFGNLWSRIALKIHSERTSWEVARAPAGKFREFWKAAVVSKRPADV